VQKIVIGILIEIVIEIIIEIGRRGSTVKTRNPAIAEGPRDAGVPVEIC